MKRNLLFGIVVLTIIITACYNPFFPDKKEKGNTLINTVVPVISVDNSNLSDVECFEGDEPILTVGVEGDEDDFSYQWYSNNEDSNENGTPIDGAVDPDFMPPTDEEGTTYYYVVITNKRNGKTTASRPVKVTVYPPSDVPVISADNSNLSDVECFEGDEPILTVGVEGDEDDFSYQWYSNAEDSNENGTPIDGAVDPDFIPPTDEPGTTYYYVVITNKRTGKTTASRPVKVTVNAPEEETFTIVLDIIDADSGDTVTASPDTGIEGDTVTLAYTVANTAHYNLLDFGGVTIAIAAVDSAGNGTRSYVINAADASSGVITITAIFTHTNLVPDPITFDDTEGHITKTYGDAAFTNAVAEGYSGSGAITYSSSDTTVASVNSSGQVTILKAGSAIITAEKAADATYAYAQADYTLTVNPKPVTITGLAASDKIYDGTTAATVSGTAAISGLVGGDTVTVSAGTAAFEDKNAGTNKAVMFNGYSLSGDDAGNYSLTQPSLTANITVKTLTITGLSASNKVYDGTTTATINGTAALNGRVTGDTVTLGGTRAAAFANKNVGTGKTVTISGYTLSGTDAGNYSLTQPSLTASITAKSLTITGLSASNKTYDGTTTVTISGTAALSGVISGDTVTLGGTRAAAFPDKEADSATYSITVSGYTISGTDAANYSLAQLNLYASINPKPLTVTGLSASNKTYDGTTTVTITGTAALSGVISGDTVTLGGTRTAAFANKNVGTGKTVTISGYTISGTNASNYSLTQPSLTANITAKSVTITGLSAANKQYDGTTTATVSGTATISGKISTDTVTVSAGTAAFANATVGNSKTVTFSGYALTGTDAGNYSLSAQPASVTANIEYVSMVQINAGTFTMGSPTTEANRNSNETQHSVTLSAFYMGKYEVTQALYQLVMGTNPSNFTTAVAGENGTPGKLPVEMVTWYDAVEFCNKLSALDGRTAVYTITGRTPASGYPITSATVTMDSSKNGYRLPTEAQWEYACRAGTTTAYNTGATISDNTGWYSSNSGSKTHEVGLKPANAWGLYDMHGNVFEWCWDWYGTYASGAQTNPVGASSGSDRVARGGSWPDSAGGLRSAYRGFSYPNYRGISVGFRLIRPNQ